MKELVLPWPHKDLSPNGRRPWTGDEVSQLVAFYESNTGVINLTDLAIRLGRDKANVCRKARSIGLTNHRRPRIKKTALPKRKHATLAEAWASIGAATASRIAKKGHPRGALGLKHSGRTKELLSAASKAMWADKDAKVNTPEHRQRLSDKLHELQVAGMMRSGYSRSRGGKREDLGGIYFRSSWEANYARYLNLLIANGQIAAWEFEPKTFDFEKIKRGTRAYTPDFKVIANDGSYEWHEVKGWMDAKSKTRLARFARYYPDEKLVVVDQKWFRSANRKLAGLIPNWEIGSRSRKGRQVVAAITGGTEE